MQRRLVLLRLDQRELAKRRIRRLVIDPIHLLLSLRLLVPNVDGDFSQDQKEDLLRRVALPDEQIALVEDARLHHERQASDDRDALPREHGDVGR